MPIEVHSRSEIWNLAYIHISDPNYPRISSSSIFAKLLFTLVNLLTKCTPKENYAYREQHSKWESFRSKIGNIKLLKGEE